MRKACRSAERLSYWPALRSRALTRREQEMPRSSGMHDKCFQMAAISLALMVLIALTLSTNLHAQGPALTTISDTVYRADGTAASGTVLISWPSFQSAEGDAVAAGNLSVTIGALGAFTVQLVPNVGASPAGTYYVAVFQLDDGTVRTEYWAVPATSPTTIAAVLTTPGTGLGNLAATQQYVNAAVAPLAVDATVVHLAGTETVTGTKQFTVPPSLPTPVGANDAANKGYVDAAVSNVGSGAYVAIAGGTMTGPLILPADLTGETATSYLGHRPYRMSTSFAWNHMHQTEFLNSRRAQRGGTDTYYAPLQPSDAFPFGHPPGATGGAWSWRRDAFEMVGGMLDTCILGSADWHQAFGLVQATNVAAEMKRCTEPYVEAVLDWQTRAAKLNRIEGRSPMGCIDNFATHAFHGSKSLRAYGERWALLQKWAFSPATDIARDYQGLWRWTGNKPGLRDDVARYFIERSEDGPMLLGETPLV
jgi:hypothetical protein